MCKITVDEVKSLQDKTGAASLMLCKKALIESEGNIEKAIQWLKENSVVQSLINWR